MPELSRNATAWHHRHATTDVYAKGLYDLPFHMTAPKQESGAATQDRDVQPQRPITTALHLDVTKGRVLPGRVTSFLHGDPVNHR